MILMAALTMTSPVLGHATENSPAKVYASCSGYDSKGNAISLEIFDQALTTKEGVKWDTKLVATDKSGKKDILLYSTDYDSADVYENYTSDDNGGLIVYFYYDDKDASPDVTVKKLGSTANDLKCHRDMAD